MSRRTRIVAFGSAAAAVLAGALCAALVGGIAGEVLTIVLFSLGLGGGLLLVFVEIGLGEEHDLAVEEQRRRKRERRRLLSRPGKSWPRRPRRPG